MKPPPMVGVVQRRLLVNYRTAPDVTARLLPAPLRPHLVNGWAVAGVCLIRLGRLRPAGFPGVLGVRSENAAHRIAAEWDTPDGVATGVYIPRRDSGSLLTVLVGGRLFPGYQHRARFDVRETADELRVAFASADRSVAVRVHATPRAEWQPTALFANLEEASAFVRRGAAGYSEPDELVGPVGGSAAVRHQGAVGPSTADELSGASGRSAAGGGRRLDGLELRAEALRLEPVEVHETRSTFFDDRTRFPAGTATFDNAMLMRDVPVEWHPLASMAVRSGVVTTDTRVTGNDTLSS